MNYFEWSQEYIDAAEDFAYVIEKLKARRKSASISERKEIDLKITKYRMFYNECIMTANHLMQRHKGVA